MDALRARLAYARAMLASHNPPQGATLTSLNSPYRLAEGRILTLENEAAFDTELTGCELYTIDGKEYYWTKEEYERMKGQTK